MPYDAIVQLRSILLGAIATAVLVLLAGCSAVGLAYNRADWLVMNYIEDRFDMEPGQRGQLAKDLAARREAHRRSELDPLINLLQRIQVALSDGTDYPTVKAALDEMSELYVTTMEKSISYLSPTFAMIKPAHLTRLEAGFAKMNEQFEERYRLDDPEARIEARIERLEDRFDFWSGAPTDAQRKLIVEHVAKAPEAFTLWYADRQRQQREFIAAVRSLAPQSGYEKLMREWWVHRKRQDPRLAEQFAESRRIYARLIYALMQTLSDEQRGKAISKLRDIEQSLREAKQNS